MMLYGLTLLTLVPYFSSSSEALSLWSSWIPKERENDSEQNVRLLKNLFQGSGECSDCLDLGLWIQFLVWRPTFTHRQYAICIL